MTVAEFKRKEEKPLNVYKVLNCGGDLIAQVEAHSIGIDVECGQIVLVHDNEELLAIVPFGMIVTKVKIKERK